jgi:hypothetical protein
VASYMAATGRFWLSGLGCTIVIRCDFQCTSHHTEAGDWECKWNEE